MLTSPLFPQAKLYFENGHILQINADGQRAEAMYVQHIQLDGQPYSKTWSNHAHLLAGGNLTFMLTDTPNTARICTEDDLPFSLSRTRTA